MFSFCQICQDESPKMCLEHFTGQLEFSNYCDGTIQKESLKLESFTKCDLLLLTTDKNLD